MTKKRIRRPQPLAQQRDAAVARARAGGCHVGSDDDDIDDDNMEEEEHGANSSNRDSNDNLTSRQIALMAEVTKWDAKISEMGGRQEYQKASQLNTDLFSTSKWVLGILGRWGWLDGLKIMTSDGDSGGCNGSDELEKDTKMIDTSSSSSSDNTKRKKGKKEKIQRRDVRLLEVGAINTQLLDAAARTRMSKSEGPSSTAEAGKSVKTERVYRLDVKAIDIRSTDPRILQMDFFDLPLPHPKPTICTTVSGDDAVHPSTALLPYDVIVSSMVINCVTTPAQRGGMLSLFYRHLRPGGLCFLTLPKLCLIQSKSMSRSYFEEILTNGVGFEILKEVGRESPKLAFFVLRRPMEEDDGGGSGEGRRWDDKFARMPVIHRGKKFRNTFAVTLNKEEVVD